jgi:hypothetical protein
MDSATEDVVGKIRIKPQPRSRHLEKLSLYRARRRISRVEPRSSAAMRCNLSGLCTTTCEARTFISLI